MKKFIIILSIAMLFTLSCSDMIEDIKEGGNKWDQAKWDKAKWGN